MKSKLISPAKGERFWNRCGSHFRCLEEGFVEGTCTMINEKSGWTLTAHNVRMYEDGSIEWDYSTNGHFLPVSAEWDYESPDYMKVVLRG